MRNALLKKGLLLLLAAATILVLTSPVGAQQQAASSPAANPLVRLLQSKGILTDEEATMVNQAATATEADQRLAQLLLSKGLITQEDYNQTVGAAMVSTVADGSGGARMIPAVLKVPVGSAGSIPAATPTPQPKAPAVIPAVAPIRVFPVDSPKHEGLIPAFKLGPVKVAPYGFFKASVVHDSSSPGGNDFPLPGFLAGSGTGANVDTGPDASPEFHIKVRGLRLGSNFEWLDPSPDITLTGRFEFDFEGNFTRVNNTSLSGIRSNQARIRLAWARVDWKASDNTTLFGLFGQDWTPFGSSTLPPLFETTGAGVFFGSLYERNPQVRFGFNYNIGGSRKVKIQPEVAVVLPAFGNVPGDLGLQLGFGERQGVDSGRPEVEGRLVTQFQLDDAPGVAPAQIIVSGMQGQRRAIVRAADVPPAFQTAFPQGASVSSSRFGYTAEVQLPTRYATLVGKYYNGEDLRFFFGGQAFSHYNDVLGLCTAAPPATCTTPSPTGAGSSIDGSDTVVFAFNAAGTAVVAPQRPVRSQGGFVNLSFPLSRIANADPAGHNAGWVMYFHYGIDFAKARDLRHFASTSTGAGAGGSRVKSDLGAVTIQYKLNPFVSFVVEESYYRTRALKGSNIAGTAIPLPFFQGVRVNAWHDFRSEIGTVFTF